MSVLDRFGRTLRRAATAVALALVVLPIASALPLTASHALAQQTQAPDPSQGQAPQAQPASPISDQVRATLSQYGQFTQTQNYGEVWVPGQQTVPQGWHPYMACNWVNSGQYGWYYNDQTPWGQIVHHYGRWTHDASLGWIWIPGQDFSPGWVVWRTSPQWVGWAPMPPDQDLQTMSAAAFNNGGFWTFIETAKFNAGCSGTEAPAGQIATLLGQTQFVTDFDYVGGIGIIVLPSYIQGPVINVNIVFQPWPIYVYEQIVIDWTLIWNTYDVVNIINWVNCPKPPPPPPPPIPWPSPPPPPPSIAPIQCPAGSYPNADGDCIMPPPPGGMCPEGGLLRDGYCITGHLCWNGAFLPFGVACLLPPLPPPSGICLPGYRLRDGRCFPNGHICPNGQVLPFGVACPLPPRFCPGGARPVNGVCPGLPSRCPNGQIVPLGTKCPVGPTHVCPDGSVLPDGLPCRVGRPPRFCPGGLHPVNGVCPPLPHPGNGGLTKRCPNGAIVPVNATCISKLTGGGHNPPVNLRTKRCPNGATVPVTAMCAPVRPIIQPHPSVYHPRAVYHPSVGGYRPITPPVVYKPLHFDAHRPVILRPGGRPTPFRPTQIRKIPPQHGQPCLDPKKCAH